MSKIAIINRGILAHITERGPMPLKSVAKFQPQTHQSVS